MTVLGLPAGDPEPARGPVAFHMTPPLRARILAAGWPDERCIGGALTHPVEPIVVTRRFEDLARSA